MHHLDLDRHGALRSIAYVAVTLGALVALAATASASSHPTDCEVEGPDAFDYKCTLDVDYEFVNTSGGEELSLGTFDRSEALQLPFTFEWYDRNVDSVYVSSEGKVCFSLDDEDCSDHPSQPVPDTATPNDLAACGWENLDPTRGTVRTMNTTVADGATEAFVVEYDGVPHWGQSETNTFQIQLLEDGTVRCMLETIQDDADGKDMTVGVENATGEEGVRYTSSGFSADQVAVAFAQVPPAPENLDAERWFQQNNVTWDPPTDDEGNEVDVDHYNVTIYDANDQELGTETTVDTTFLDDGNNQDVPGPGDDTTRSYEVAAVDEVGTGSRAGPVDATTYGTPSEPLDVDAEPGNVTGAANLTWATPEHPNRTDVYHTYYAVQSDLGDACPDEPDVSQSAWTAGPNETPSTTETRLTDLDPGTVHCFTVTAANDDDAPGVGEGDAAIANASIAAGAPSEPQNVAAEPGPDQGDVNVTWQAPDHLNGTDVYHTFHAVRSNLGDACPEQPDPTTSDWTAGPDTDPAITEATITGLNPGTVYCLTVTAEDQDVSDGEGDAAPADDSVPAGPPAPPRNPTAEQVDDLSFAQLEVEVCWDPPETDGGSDVTEYTVDRRVSDVPPSLEVSDFGERAGFEAPIEDCPLVDSAIDCARTYEFQVSARNGFGESAPSEIVNATISGVCPTAPQNPDAVAGTSSDETPDVGDIEVNWTEPADPGQDATLEAYHVFRCEGNSSSCAGTPATEWDEVSTTSDLTILDQDLDQGTAYTYQIVARNDNTTLGNNAEDRFGHASDLVNTTVPAQPSPPQNVNASNEDNNATINVAWDPPAEDGGTEILEYHVYQRQEPNGDFEEVPESPVPADRTHLVVEPAPGHYCYAVSANNTFEGNQSPQDPSVNGDACATAATATAPDCGGLFASTLLCPSTPEDFTGEVDELNVTLDWAGTEDFPAEASDGENATTFYRVYRSVDDCQALEQEAEPSDPGYNDTGLDPATTYCYQVSAVRGTPLLSGFVPFESERTDTITVETPAPPSPPTAVTVTSPADGETEVTWEAPDHANGTVSYTVERDDACTGAWSSVATDASSPVTEGNLSAGEYCYRVIAEDDIDTSQPSSDSAEVANGEPTKPLGVSAEQETSGEICVTWKRPDATGGSPLDHYVIERRAQDTDDWSKVGEQAADGTRELCEDGLVSGVTYEYHVAAVNTELDEDGNQVPGKQGEFSAPDSAEA